MNNAEMRQLIEQLIECGNTITNIGKNLLNALSNGPDNTLQDRTENYPEARMQAAPQSPAEGCNPEDAGHLIPETDEACTDTPACKTIFKDDIRKRLLLLRKKDGGIYRQDILDIINRYSTDNTLDGIPKDDYPALMDDIAGLECLPGKEQD